MEYLKLEEKIDLWKASLREAGAFSEAQLYELEDHLQERLNDLLARGYAEEAAFEEATTSIGQPIELSAVYSINNRPLILKQLLLFFLLGFPLVAFIFQLFYFLWNLTGIVLIENGLRGFDYSVAIMIPGTLLLLTLAWKTFRNPYWLVQVPRKLIQQRPARLLAILGFVSTLLMAQHVFYTEWLFDNGFLNPKTYLQFDFAEPLSVLNVFSWITLIIIPLMLFFSIVLDTIQRNSFSKNLWNKICLATMLIGFHVFTSLRNVVQFLFFSPIKTGSFRETEIAIEMVSICGIIGLSTIGLLLLRKMDKKGRLISGA